MEKKMENEMEAREYIGIMTLYGGFPKLGVPFGDPYNKDYGILGSILGYPNFGKLPWSTLQQFVLKDVEIIRTTRITRNSHITGLMTPTWTGGYGICH